MFFEINRYENELVEEIPELGYQKKNAAKTRVTPILTIIYQKLPLALFYFLLLLL